MLISPRTAIAEGWIKFPEWMSPDFQQKCIQPNAIDITMDRAFTHEYSGAGFVISEDHKQMIKQVELPPTDGFVTISPNGLVDIMSDFYITVPAGVAATFIVRSTLNRNGIFATNGLYDQGFSNYCGLVLHNRSSLPAKIAPRTRIAQVLFITAEDSGLLYTGTYNNNKGTHWSESST